MACGSCGTGGTGGCSSGACGTDACPSLQAFDWLTDLGVAGPTRLFEAVEVQFKGGRKAFFHVPPDVDAATGDLVVVEVERGIDCGHVHLSGELARLRYRSQPADDAYLPNVVRRGTVEDWDRWEANRADEREAMGRCRERIEALDLPMKLVDAEWQFDRKKITFYFTAEQRVDFRQLVRDLAALFRTRVELRQIGARDGAARIGGIGSCGRELCCSTWLTDFKPVSTQAARAQNLPLNPTRLSGQCGRLKCCLNYELEHYMKALKEFPRADTPVKTPQGAGTVRQIDIFRRRVWVEYEDHTWVEFTLEAIAPFLPRRAAPRRRE